MNRTKDKVGDTAESIMKHLAVAVRGIFARRQFILCAMGLGLAALLLWLLLPLIPRTAKPENYRVGEMEIQAITQVVGYRKVLGVTESLSGIGRAESGSYTYRAGNDPDSDIQTYYTLLREEYGAAFTDESDTGEGEGYLALAIPSPVEGYRIAMTITYDSEEYVVTVDEEIEPRETASGTPQEVNVTPEQARELVLSLTKAETGFKADISVYTTELEEEKVSLDGWDYYVFTVIADYSATRIEYRGTFYVGCYDGVVLSYDKDTGTTSRLRGSGGRVETAE